MGRCAYPEENEHSGQESRRDDGVQRTDAGVGDEGGEEAAREIGNVHEDEEVGCGGAAEVEGGLAVGDDLERGCQCGYPGGGFDLRWGTRRT